MTFETIEYKGKKIEIYQDNDPMCPRADSDNLGTMICFHNSYDLGDAHTYSLAEAIAMLKDKTLIALPLYLYDHSGITMNTVGFECRWDSGQVGMIFVTKKAIREEYKWNKITKARVAKIRSYLQAEVEEYDQYLTGDVYGYTTGDDSCWGFYGHDHEKSGLLEYAQNAIDCQLTEERKADLVAAFTYVAGFSS